VAGGIGITPILSIYKFLRTNPNSNYSKVVLIWSEKEANEAKGLYKDQFEKYIQPEHAIESKKSCFQEKFGNTIFEYHFHITSINKDKKTELQQTKE
jgi:predicted ferric reductase